MRVYVESNFLLELALQQAESAACEELLREAERGDVRLVIPAFALIEPETTLHRRKARWNALAQEVDIELREVVRTAAVAADARALQNVFVKTAQLAGRGLDDVRARILGCAEVLPIDANALRDAERLRVECDLELEDAVMLACVLANATPEATSVFINSNSSDFGDAGVRAKLDGRGCKFIAKFVHGLDFVRAMRARADEDR